MSIWEALSRNRELYRLQAGGGKTAQEAPVAPVAKMDRPGLCGAGVVQERVEASPVKGAAASLPAAQEASAPAPGDKDGLQDVFGRLPPVRVTAIEYPKAIKAAGPVEATDPLEALRRHLEPEKRRGPQPMGQEE